jgi:acyl transferase domain-containing protein
LIVLKRLSDALADSDPILALIRGSAMNQDGHTNGLTAPNGLSQRQVIRRALQNGGVKPSEITYVETHGTGTALGDPIEVEALTEVLGQSRSNGPACVLGSVKTNIGHLEGAAGIAGLIKTVLCLQHGEIPPHLHFKELNPHISLENTPFEIHPKGSFWPAGMEKRYAAVSSFGFGGTNAHVILEGVNSPSYVVLGKSQRITDNRQQTTGCYLLPISARSPKALHALARSYQNFFSLATCDLPLACYTASNRRTHHEHRLAVVVHSFDELNQKLGRFLQSEEDPAVIFSDCKIQERQKGLAFVFSGQGPQWYAMGRELLEQEPVIRKTIDKTHPGSSPAE